MYSVTVLQHTDLHFFRVAFVVRYFKYFTKRVLSAHTKSSYILLQSQVDLNETRMQRRVERNSYVYLRCTVWRRPCIGRYLKSWSSLSLCLSRSCTAHSNRIKSVERRSVVSHVHDTASNERIVAATCRRCSFSKRHIPAPAFIPVASLQPLLSIRHGTQRSYNRWHICLPTVLLFECMSQSVASVYDIYPMYTRYIPVYTICTRAKK